MARSGCNGCGEDLDAEGRMEMERDEAYFKDEEPDIDASCNESLDWRYCSGGGMGDCGNCINGNGGQG